MLRRFIFHTPDTPALSVDAIALVFHADLRCFVCLPLLLDADVSEYLLLCRYYAGDCYYVVAAITPPLYVYATLRAIIAAARTLSLAAMLMPLPLDAHALLRHTPLLPIDAAAAEPPPLFRCHDADAFFFAAARYLPPRVIHAFTLLPMPADTALMPAADYAAAYAAAAAYDAAPYCCQPAALIRRYAMMLRRQLIIAIYFRISPRYFAVIHVIFERCRRADTAPPLIRRYYDCYIRYAAAFRCFCRCCLCQRAIAAYTRAIDTPLLRCC